MRHAAALVLLVACLASMAFAATPGFDPVPKAKSQSATPKPAPAELQPEQVEGYVATLNDTQARGVLVETLRRDAAARQAEADDAEAGAAQLLTGLRGRIRHVGDCVKATRLALEDWREHGQVVLRNLADDHGAPAVGAALWVLALMLAVGATVEFALSRVLPHPPMAHPDEAPRPWLTRLSDASLALLVKLVRITGFTLAAFAASYVGYGTGDPMRELLLAVLAWSFFIRVWFAVSRVALAPARPGARLVQLGDASSRRLHRDGLLLFGWASASFFAVGLLKILGLEPRLLDLVKIVCGAVFALLLALCFTAARHGVNAALTAPGSSRLSHGVAHTWLPLSIGYLTLAWAFWAMNVLQGDHVGAAAAMRSLFILLAVPLVDRLAGLAFGRLLRDRTGIDGSPLPQFARARRLARIGLRLLLAGAALVLLVEAWGGELLRSTVGSPIGGTVVRAAFSVTVALLLTWVAWEAIAHFIDRRLVKAPAGEESAVSREQTLLPLLRRFLIGVLITMVTLIILSSLGVDIGPLLAGAGIVGIAIGFGAQTLVRDIVSGLFFLIDDAFRVGEYVDVGRLRGTVERITVRALVLRHHRGALHTVPFGQIQAITNYNRDWLVEKIEMRLPYDVDVDKIKKLMKQIGKELQEDPEIGPQLIETLKSQGMMRFDSGGVVLRAKFMCKPREQFKVRREALKRIQKAFAENNIQFAEPAVTVRGHGGDPLLAAAAAQAAANDVNGRPPPGVATSP